MVPATGPRDVWAELDSIFEEAPQRCPQCPGSQHKRRDSDQKSDHPGASESQPLQLHSPRGVLSQHSSRLETQAGKKTAVQSLGEENDHANSRESAVTLTYDGRGHGLAHQPIDCRDRKKHFIIVDMDRHQRDSTGSSTAVLYPGPESFVDADPDQLEARELKMAIRALRQRVRYLQQRTLP